MLYPGDGDELVVGDTHPFYSPNAGTTWHQMDETALANLHVDVRALFLDRQFDALPVLWAASDGGGPTGVQFNIANWTWQEGSGPVAREGIRPTDLAAWQTYYATPVVADNGQRRLLVGTLDNAGGCFDDVTGTAVYGLMAPHPGPLPTEGDFLSLVVHQECGRAYFRTTSPDLYRATDARAESCFAMDWEHAPSEIPGAPLTFSRDIMAIHPNDGLRLYAIGATGLAISPDGGDTWGPVRGLPRGARPTAIAVDSDGVIVIGTEGAGAFVSTNEGRGGGNRGWRPFGLNGNSPESILTVVIGEPTGPLGLRSYWLGTTRGLYRRDGRAWTRVFPNVPERTLPWLAASAVAIDPQCPSRIYLGVGNGSESLRQGVGVFVSHQGGDPGTWELLGDSSDAHRSPVSAVTVDLLDSDLVYVGTFGRGAWLYDWDGALPACGE